MNKAKILRQLESLGSEQIRKVLRRHGAQDPFFGVRIGDMKTIIKQIKKDYNLSMELYDTGNSDAMYLAGLIADEARMTKADLQKWVKKAYWYLLSDCTVAWIAAESRFGWELGLEWIESDQEMIASAGWSTIASLVAIKEDSKLNITKIDQLLDRCGDTIHSAPNRVRYTMNNFLISVGCYVAPLTYKSEKIADTIGKITVYMGETSCKVPLATDYIKKVKSMGRIGKKKQQARC